MNHSFIQYHSSNDDLPKKIALSLVYDATRLVKLVSVFPTTKLIVRKNYLNHMVPVTDEEQVSEF